MSAQLKILIVEDDAIIAELINHHLLQFGFNVLDIVHNSEKALDKIHNLQPDLVLLDITILGTKDGIDIAHIIDEKYDIPYIFLTALSDKATLERAKHVSPIGYIVKPFKENDLLATITIGMSNYSKNEQTKITQELVNEHSLSPISTKEFEILIDISTGLTNNQIADKQDISANTVKWYTQNIYSKLGVKNRTAAAQFLTHLK